VEVLAFVECLDLVGDGEPLAGVAGEGLPGRQLVREGGEEAFGSGVVPVLTG